MLYILYFDSLSLRNTSKALSRFVRSHTAIRDWIQKYKPKRILIKRKKVNENTVDETMIKVGSSEYVWLWVIIEPKDKEILSITISKGRNMLVAERCISKVVEKYGSHPVSTEMVELGITSM